MDHFDFIKKFPSIAPYDAMFIYIKNTKGQIDII